MIKKPKFIKNNEKSLGVFSSLEVVWSEAFTGIINVKTEFDKKIYKTKQGFYLYLLLGEVESNLIVYYNQSQYSELTIFIQQLLKQFNNDKTTNK
jgi:hypothetical protein